MKLISRNQQAALLKVLLASQSQFSDIRGIYYLDIGFKYINRLPTTQLALRLHVHHKTTRRQLEPSQLIPDHLGNFPTDVIQSNLQLHSKSNLRDERCDPLLGGIAIRNLRQNMLGTLGAIVFDQKEHTWAGLSNHHVLVGDTGQLNDSIAQPATSNLNDIIGTVSRWNEDLDCALCTLNSSRRLSPRIMDVPAVPSGIKEPLLGMTVIKSGRTTGTTYGVVEGVSEFEFTIIPLQQNTSASNSEISAPGDSGSLWLDTVDYAAVGLHYAGEKDPDPLNERAWAKKMTLIAQALDISFKAPG